MPRERCTTVKELAYLLRLHPETVRKWVREGEVPHLRLPDNGIRFTPQHVAQIMSQHRDSREQQ